MQRLLGRWQELSQPWVAIGGRGDRSQHLLVGACAASPSACTAAALFTKWSASSMASAGPRGRSRDSPITRMRISVSSRMGTSEHSRRKKLQETPDINHTLHSSLAEPSTDLTTYLSRRYITASFPDLQLQM